MAASPSVPGWPSALLAPLERAEPEPAIGAHAPLEWELICPVCELAPGEVEPPQYARRHSHAGAAVDGDVWIFGGMTAVGASDDLLQLRPSPPAAGSVGPGSAAGWEWRRRVGVGTPPPPLCLHAMVAYERELLVFGGLAQDTDASGAPVRAPTDGLWLLHLPTCRWSMPATTGAPPCARVGHAAAVRALGGANAQLFVYGGFVLVESADADESAASTGYLNDLTLLARRSSPARRRSSRRRSRRCIRSAPNATTGSGSTRRRRRTTGVATRRPARLRRARNMATRTTTAVAARR